MSEAIPGQRPKSVRPSATSDENRVCEDEDCTTVLSKYNATPYCSVHKNVRRFSPKVVREASRPRRS